MPECIYCHNDFSDDEINPVTKQCTGCDEWDRAEPQRRAESEERIKWREQFKNVNFQYVPGDPYW